MRLTLRAVLLAVLCLASVFPRPALASVLPRGRSEITASLLALGVSPALRLRIGITQDGITRLTSGDLAAAGIDLAAVDPRTFAMSSLGAAIAIQVSGEEDGRFDAEDRILFFGQRFRGPEMDQKYTDERVYWLDIGGEPGPRMAVVDATPQGNLAPPADVSTTLHAEENRIWWALHTLALDTQDTWFWERLSPFGPGAVVTATLPYFVPDPVSGATATLRVEQVGRTYTAHRSTVALNGSLLHDAGWYGRVRKIVSAIVPAGVLAHGANTVAVGDWNLPDVVADEVMVNYWELDYRRQFRAWQGRFDFVAEAPGVQEYVIGGWGSDAVAVWDVSDPTSPRQLAGASLQMDGPAYSLRYRAGDGAAGGAAAPRYWLQEAASYLSPASVRLRPATGLRAPEAGADAVIVTAAEFRAAAERLAAWHAANGRRALVASFADVCDEFNEGIYHPKAVPAMLAWAAAHWPSPAPRFLTLVGDGHWNMKGYNPDRYPPAPNPIPPYLDWADPWQGEVPADGLYGDLNGDGVPEVAVGRLAVNTPAEADAVVDKIITYDQAVRAQPWQRRALFVSDNPDGSGNFPAVSDEIADNYLPPDLQIVRAYLPGNPPAVPATEEQIIAARAAIAAALEAGVWLVQYTGHGAPQQWAGEAIWQTSDIGSLRNGVKLPVVMTFNCLDGYFAHPDPAWASMAETMQRHIGGGSAAAISPSGLGTTPDQHAFRKILMAEIFGRGVRELGTALTLAKQRFAAEYGAHYLVKTMMLYGDPAMQLAVRAPRLYHPMWMKSP